MKSSNWFASAFLRLLHEDSSAFSALGGSAGGFDPEKGQITSADFYAPGDARIPKGSNTILTRAGALKKRRKRRKRKSSN